MKLLIIAQSVDKNNPVLGFFHEWIKEFAKKFESIVVICLEKGEYDLPSNVKVLSLGKEEGKSRLKYLYRFYRYIWAERKNYDTVFVHMNQEYVLLGWKTWWLFRKPIYMWRNHQSGSFLTDLAAFSCKKVFCTSRFSYTAKYKKTVLMPVGIDTQIFNNQHPIPRKKNSILFLGRIARIKKPDLLIDVLANIKDLPWTLTIVGNPRSEDMDYYQSLKKKTLDSGVNSRVSFQKGALNTETPAIYAAHEIFVNLSPSGLYDKTIFEAMATGCLVLTSNENLRGKINDNLFFKEGDNAELQKKLRGLLQYFDADILKIRPELRSLAKEHDLNTLSQKLYNELSK